MAVRGDWREGSSLWDPNDFCVDPELSALRPAKWMTGSFPDDALVKSYLKILGFADIAWHLPQLSRCLRTSNDSKAFVRSGVLVLLRGTPFPIGLAF